MWRSTRSSSATTLEPSYSLRAELGLVDGDAEALRRRPEALLAQAGRRAAARGNAGAAARLLQRAVDLLAVDARVRLEVLPDYGLALREADLQAAERVLVDAIEQARERG